MKEKRSRKELSQKSVPKNPNKGVLCPKIDTAERRRQSGKNPRLGKSLNFKGTVSFLHIRGIKRYFPTAPLPKRSRAEFGVPAVLWSEERAQ